MNTSGYGGHTLNKTIVVMTNDPQRPNLEFKIRGKVQQIVSIQPPNARLAGLLGQELKSEILITPAPEHSFKIIKAWTRSGENIRFELKENRISGYLLTVENLKKDEGRYYDVIFMQTDSSMRPQLKISVFGNIYRKAAATN